jgi:hypothetical protein
MRDYKKEMKQLERQRKNAINWVLLFFVIGVIITILSSCNYGCYTYIDNYRYENQKKIDMKRNNQTDFCKPQKKDKPF